MTEVQNATVPAIVKTKPIVADVQVPTQHDVVVSTRNYILSSASMATIINNVNVPDWLKIAVEAQIAASTGDTSKIISELDAFVRGLDTGVAQKISALQSEYESKYNLTTQVVAELGNDITLYYNDINSKVDATQATTLFTNLLTAQFNTPESDANAWILSSTQTLANEQAAQALDIAVLQADYGDLSPKLVSVENVIAGEVSIWDGVSTPTLGQYKIVNEVYFQYLGGTLGPNQDGWVTSSAAQALSWAGYASKLLYNPTTNAVTGWEFGDGSAGNSTFKISADKFSLVNADGSATPLVIDATDPNDVQMTFSGVVNFTNTDMSGYDNNNVAAGNPVVYRQTTAPANSYLKENDVWYDLDDLYLDVGYETQPKQYLYVNSVWTLQAAASQVSVAGYVEYDVAQGVNNNTTTIDGGKITTNTLNADRILANTIWSNGVIQSSDFVAWTTGFRLKANAAGTTSDPTIFGAYIKGGTVEGTTVKASNISFGGVNFLSEGSTTHFGRTGYSTGASAYIGNVTSAGSVLTIGTLVMPLWSSGFDARRALSLNSSIMVEVRGFLDVEYQTVTTIYLDIQRSISGGTWTTLKTLSNPVYRYNNISYGAYSLSCVYTGTFSGIASSGYVSYRARIRTNADNGVFCNLAGTLTLQN